MPAVTNLTYAVLDQTLENIERQGGSVAVTQALREPKRAWSYHKLHEEVCRAAAALKQLGLRSGDRVVLLMHDGVEMAAALLGAIRAGLCAVPLPDTLRQRELLATLQDAGAQVVVAHADLVDMVALLAPQVPSLKAVLSLGGNHPSAQDFAALCFDADPHFDPVSPRSGLPALLLYDTGPDGRPQGYAYPHEVPLLAYETFAVPIVKLTSEDRVFSTSRLSCRFGLGMNLFFPLRAGALSFLLPDQVRGRAVFDVLGSFRPTVFAGTASLYNQLVQDFLEMSAPRPSYFTSVRLSLSCGEQLAQAVERRLRGVFQLQLCHCFCVQEAFHVVLHSPCAEGRASLCTRPVPGLSVRVRNDRGEPAASAEIGPLELSGPQIRGGPWCDKTGTMKAVEPGTWVVTGERFFPDEGGAYLHVGRTDGLYPICDWLVSPYQVEQTLLGHPAVWECAVLGDQDEDGLLQTKAYVVLNVGRDPDVKLARELIEFVKRQISPHKSPRAVEFLQQLPRGPDGKVARWRLRTKSVPPAFTPPSGLTPILSPPSGMTPIVLTDRGPGKK